MSLYRIEHIADGRFIHAEAETSEDPALARACEKYGWSLDNCRVILLEQNPEPLEPLAMRK